MEGGRRSAYPPAEPWDVVSPRTWSAPPLTPTAASVQGTLRSGSLPLLSGRLLRASRIPAIPLQSRPGLSLDVKILQDLFHTHPGPRLCPLLPPHARASGAITAFTEEGGWRRAPRDFQSLQKLRA